tara:strand:- start:7814 stop:8863 length:1050 start_codon:yes stop_codon:yes gene_type:complete
MKFIITGGAGFIGSSVIRYLINTTKHSVINIDKLTYAGNLQSLDSISDSDRYSFYQIDICNENGINNIFEEYEPDIVMHLAAESHVDRSIDNPDEFIKTNLYGTYVLLEAARKLHISKKEILFHHISTDEVFGDLKDPLKPFDEETPYDPSSPYSASKAGSDHLVRSWGRTFNLPFIVTNCSNNYGPFQFPEKLIPHVIINALNETNIPIYGDGMQIRDWLYVEDHAKALVKVATEGRIGETYNVGCENQRTNIEMVQSICSILDELLPDHLRKNSSFSDLICFVKDRPGHDRHYAINPKKIVSELGWKAEESLESGLLKTVKWYIENDSWIKNILSGEYKLGRIGVKE